VIETIFNFQKKSFAVFFLAKSISESTSHDLPANQVQLLVKALSWKNRPLLMSESPKAEIQKKVILILNKKNVILQILCDVIVDQ